MSHCAVATLATATTTTTTVYRLREHCNCTDPFITASNTARQAANLPLSNMKVADRSVLRTLAQCTRPSTLARHHRAQPRPAASRRAAPRNGNIITRAALTHHAPPRRRAAAPHWATPHQTSPYRITNTTPLKYPTCATPHHTTRTTPHQQRHRQGYGQDRHPGGGRCNFVWCVRSLLPRPRPRPQRHHHPTPPPQLSSPPAPRVGGVRRPHLHPSPPSLPN